MKRLILPILILLMVSAGSSQDWPLVNYDSAMSRHSPQTVIGPNNVNQLQVKWIFGTNQSVEQSPLIVGKTGYIQNNNRLTILAFDMDTGLSKWAYYPNFTAAVATEVGHSAHGVSLGGAPHGLTYDNGVIYGNTGNLGTIVALDANTGRKIWESPALYKIGGLFQTVSPPIVYKNLVIVGSAGGDVPPPGIPIRGFIAALDINTGNVVWRLNTTQGAWVENGTGIDTNMNGGADPWNGGSADMEKGVAYIPCGNAAPDFNDSTRPGYNNYTNHIIAVNMSDGKMLWATPLVAKGTVLNITAAIPDVHDYDPSFGTSLATLNVNGTLMKIVVAHDKHGDIVGLDPDTGKVLWARVLGIIYHDWTKPTYNGSVAWPGTQNGVEDYVANDNSTVYAAVSNSGFIYYLDNSKKRGHAAPAFDMMPNGIGNGSIYAIDIATGNIKWEHKTDFPTWCSPLVTNGLVFTGHITATGKPYDYDEFAVAQDNGTQMPSGILMALDANTGQILWEFNVGAPLGIGGPSIGNGMLLVPTGAPGEVNLNAGGWIVAFGLPSGTGTGTAGLQNATSSAAGAAPIPTSGQPITALPGGNPANMPVSGQPQPGITPVSGYPTARANG